MTERFVDWGIPAPALNAALSAWTEFLGGLLIVLGLFTRLVSIPLFINKVDLDGLFLKLGVALRRGVVELDDRAPLAPIRRAITERR